MSARLQSGDVVHRGETVPDYVLEVGQGCQTWTRDRCGFLLDNPEYPVLRSWTKEDCMTRDYGPIVVISVAPEPEVPAEPGGTWVAVRPDDPRIVDGESRVRLNGSEGTAGRYGTPRLYATNPGREAWMSHHEDGPDVELWVPAERTLPLPTEPGPFWGRVELSSVTTWTGWILYAPESSDPRPYVTPVLVGGDDFHGAHRVTHLPVPADELTALHARLGVQS